MKLLPLDFVDLVSAIALMGVAIGLSAWERLGLELKLLNVTFRTILQLVVLGYIFDFIFEQNNPGYVLAILTVLLIISAIVTRNRIDKKITKILPLVGGAMLISTAIAVLYVNFLIIQPEPWFNPQYIIPLTGIILANAMNAAAVSGERLLKTINSSYLEIETHLSLGATPQQAVKQYRQDAIRAGLIPTINQMTLIGMITLPAIFSGQLLSGVEPSEAASYQILIMFAIAFANFVTTILVTKGICHISFNSVSQLIKH
ncbi:MAG: iron export ABC transporter permease subunit FetB [Cyanobacteria bacterium P01_A01_bin.84]